MSLFEDMLYQFEAVKKEFRFQLEVMTIQVCCTQMNNWMNELVLYQYQRIVTV